MKKWEKILPKRWEEEEEEERGKAKWEFERQLELPYLYERLNSLLSK